MFARIYGLIREHIIKPITRSGQWPTVRKKFLLDNPKCAACGSESSLNVHHKMPFHDDPSKELDPNNLITLCMGSTECHLKIGHGGDFKAYNPNVEDMCKNEMENPELREKLEEEAKKNRVY